MMVSGAQAAAGMQQIKLLSWRCIVNTHGMKNLFLFGLMAMVLVFSSCNNPTEARLEKLSPSGKVKVTIEGKRFTGIEPWKVTIKVKAYDFKEGSLLAEIAAKNLTDENVKVTWFEESSADIVFTQSDDKTRTFRLIANANEMQMAEIPAEAAQ